MAIKRRSFIKQMALVSVAIGWQAKRAQIMLAESTGRKLALLVGINQYTDVPALRGAVSDVDLQKDLLINRFAFKSPDILTLKDAQATREAIETAFLEHLTDQVKADDVVLIHYSGYGREGKKSRSLCAIDEDILETTLLDLVRTLPTNRLTLVLDTSFYCIGKPLQGDLRIRSHPIPETTITEQEALFNDQLNQKYKLGTSSPGVYLRATDEEQVAAEVTINGFSAGLFTYALTQYLWSVSPASKVQIAIQKAAQTVATLQQQQKPQIVGLKNKTFLSYFVTPETALGAEAIVSSLDEVSNTIQIKLVGLTFTVLNYSGVNSSYSLAGHPEIVLQVKSKEGQIAKARLLNDLTIAQTPLVVGSLLQEAIRTIPRDLSLVIALDSSLERIERVDATSALSTLPLPTSIVPVGESTADCLLSKLKSKNDPTAFSYAIFSPSGQLLPPGSSPNDALKSAIGRLIPQLKELLALKLWQLTLNSSSSTLAMKVSLETKEKITLIQKGTRGTPVLANLVSVPTVNDLQYRLENLSEQAITALLVSFDPKKGMSAKLLIPEVIQPQETYLQEVTKDELGTSMYIICAWSSFEKTKKLLETISETSASNKTIYSLDIVQSILEDLNQEGASTTSSDFYRLDLKSWVTFSFVY